MALIDQTYFKDEIFIPFSVRDNSQEDEVIRFINDYENILLQKCLGYTFYTLFRDGLLATPVAQRWIDLRDGIEWIDKWGKLHGWQTIRNADANYVYYYFMRNKITNTAMIGETSVNTENSLRTSPASKMSKAWTDMQEQLKQMWFMLQWRVVSSSDNTAVYPEFVMEDVCCSEFKGINIFGI
jgi:hypothetical protein